MCEMIVFEIDWFAVIQATWHGEQTVGDAKQ